MIPVGTLDGKYFHQTASGAYWRVFNYIDNTKTYDVVSTQRQAFEGGKAFGQFQFLLSDLSPCELYETIVDFHNIKRRLFDFRLSMATDNLDRVKSLVEEINIINSHADSMGYITKMAALKKIPIRIVHNDTKFNNILLDKDDRAQCVIDLDTVMPGYVAYDFGDGVRTIVNTGQEDEGDISKIGVNLTLYSAFTEGYLSETISFLNAQEIRSLSEGAILFPYMQAVRFLTDYINGDRYYKTDFKEHNLQRARAQLQLFLKSS
nr:aminoglycoside phosphotransferase family protein [Pedobacter sp. ASV2]